MLEARLIMQAPGGILHHMLHNARLSDIETWVSRVRDVRRKLGGIKCVSEWLVRSDLQKCYVDADFRATCLQAFRRKVVLPALDSYDLAAYQTAASKSSWPYQYFQGQPMRFEFDVLLASFTAHECLQYKVWAIAKATGRLPLSSFGFPHAVTDLEECPMCRYPNADLGHVLRSCSGTLHVRQAFFPSARQWPDFQVTLFRGPHCASPDGRLAYRVSFVASALQVLANALHDAGFAG